MSRRLEWWVDRGGTFTDCVVRDLDTGELDTTKVRSSDDAVERAMAALVPNTAPTGRVKLGTTLATNALLERTGAATVLVTNQGLEDLQLIGDQTRPELFSLRVPPRQPLATEAISVLTTQDGELWVDEMLPALRNAKKRGAHALAVALMHATRDGRLENQIAALAEETGFDHVSVSHQVANRLGLLARADTTVANAYTEPLLRGYLAHLARALPKCRVACMQSHGALIDAQQVRAKDIVLSGPAAGAIATASVADAIGITPVIGFDMGGTSTDVCRYDGELRHRDTNIIGGVAIHAPTVAIHTVASGGGSICRCIGGRLSVGPQSAGANPGPLSYGQPDAHEVTLTDASVVLGRLSPERFPFKLDQDAAARGLARIASELAEQGQRLSVEQVAAGLVEIAAHHMASAIRQVTLTDGYDVRDHALVAFGGAAGQYACTVAQALGIGRIVFHPLAGVLSAFGMGVAAKGWRGERDAGSVPLGQEDPTTWDAVFDALEREGREALSSRQDQDELRIERHVALRYSTTDAVVEVAPSTPAEMADAFRALHQARFGYVRPDYPIEVVSLRVAAEHRHAPPVLPKVVSGHGDPVRYQQVWSVDRFERAPVYRREDLAIGRSITGPAVISERIGTLVVDRGFTATMDAQGLIDVRDTTTVAGRSPAARAADPVLLEVFRNRFMAIAEQMGAVLQRTGR